MNTKKIEYHVSRSQIKEESKIIEASKRNIDHFAPLYDKYYIPIFRFIYQRVDSEDNAADICSQVFLKAMSNIRNYEFRGLPFSSWLYRIARNEIIMAYRNNNKDRIFNAKTENIIGIIDELEDVSDKEEKLQKMLKAIDSLKNEDVELLEMRYFEQRRFKEIAEILDKPIDSLKVKVSRLLKRLRNQIL